MRPASSVNQARAAQAVVCDIAIYYEKHVLRRTFLTSGVSLITLTCDGLPRYKEETMTMCCQTGRMMCCPCCCGMDLSGAREIMV